MYVSGIHEAEIVAYGLVENDYKNYFNEIDKNRISHHEVLYDTEFIYNEFLKGQQFIILNLGGNVNKPYIIGVI